MGTGWGRGLVSSWCWWTNSLLMNIPVAPELTSTEVVIACREVAIVSSTWMFRDWGFLLGSTYVIRGILAWC